MRKAVCKYCGGILTISFKDYGEDSGYDSPDRWIVRHRTESCSNCGYFKRLNQITVPDDVKTRNYWNTLESTRYCDRHIPTRQSIGDGFLKSEVLWKPGIYIRTSTWRQEE